MLSRQFLNHVNMADYWVSQNRKYCDFCKCWITDNKPSVDFHEKGRRHQANVKKKLQSISRHTTQVQKETDRFDATLKQMEARAMDAYKKDVANNADLTSMAINKQIKENNLAVKEGSSSGCEGAPKMWNETKTRDGKSYYVNIMTKETVWTAPPDGYYTVQEQRDRAEIEARDQLKALEKLKKKEGLLTMQQVKQEEMEMQARLAREKMKERRVTDPVTSAPATVTAPLLDTSKPDPYGKWVVCQEKPPMDLQLPVQPEWYVPVVSDLPPEPPIKEFKEKQVESIGGGESTFRKRKIGSGAKRNMRQRLDDD